GRLLATKGHEAITGHSVAIYQVLYAMRQRAAKAEVPEVGKRWAGKSRQPHTEYCEALEKALPSLVADTNVHRSERGAVLADDNMFPLVSADGRHCVTMTDRHYRQMVLGEGVEGEIEALGEAEAVQAFPLLRSATQSAHQLADGSDA
ncbi:hypothetical protein, partial [Paraburkholderia sediminicola]|uniref:hypothetical protein n=1 Tax=Paraburkholderia sediminicola TaxID=458836 RepID=UPI0038BB7C5F